MTIKPLIILPDPILREKSRELERIDAPALRLAQDMLETMYQAPGIGLAAIQVGVAVRLLVLDVSPKEALPDPRIFLIRRFCGRPMSVIFMKRAVFPSLNIMPRLSGRNI